MGEELGEVYTALWQQVTWLYSKWGEYVALFGTNQDRIEILNATAPAFFKTVQNSLWEDILIHIARITDSSKSAGKENLSVHRLPTLISEDRRETVEELLSSVRETSAFARDWRNRRIAHRDLKLALNHEAKPLKAASRAHVQSALGALSAVLNHLSNSYLGSTTMFEFASEPSAGGALSMLHYLRAGKESEQ